MPKSKKISISLVVITTVLLTVVGLLGIEMFVKIYSITKPTDIIRVDSLNILKQKDSSIKCLQIDNNRLKQMFDDKHDTVFIPKPVYIKVKSDSTQHE